MKPTLHYVYDPLCGWCYSVEKLVHAAASAPEIRLELHAGGLWPEPTRLPEPTRQYIRAADARIAAMSGQSYSQKYFETLLPDPEMTLHSAPTIAAVLAAQAIDEDKALAMLAGIQAAHYVDGRHVVRREVLIDVARQIGLPEAEFVKAMDAAPVAAHVSATQRIMQRLGVGGFPAFAVEYEGRWTLLPHQNYYGNPAAFRDLVVSTGTNSAGSAHA